MAGTRPSLRKHAVAASGTPSQTKRKPEGAVAQRRRAPRDSPRTRRGKTTLSIALHGTICGMPSPRSLCDRPDPQTDTPINARRAMEGTPTLNLATHKPPPLSSLCQIRERPNISQALQRTTELEHPL